MTTKGWCRWRARLLAGVLACLSGLTACGGPTTPELISRAEVATEEGRLRAAVIDLRSAVAGDPENAEARFLLGKAALAVGNAATAEKELRRAREMGWDAQATRVPMARALLALGRPREALTELSQADPVTATVVALRGEAFQRLGNDEQALASYRRALEMDDGNQVALLGSARYALVKGDRASARESLQRALSLYPDSPEVRLIWGRFLYGTGDIVAAETQFREGLALPVTGQRPSDQWELELSLVEALLAQGKLDESEAAIGRLDQMQPDHVLVQYLGARLAFERRDLLRANDLIDRVVVQAPEFAPALMLQGTIRLARGDFAQARQSLQLVVDRQPENVQARKLLAAAERGRVPAEAGAGRDAVEGAAGDAGTAPTPVSDAEMFALLGDANAQTGDYGSALALWRRALQEDPDNEEIKLQLLATYALANLPEQAREILDDTEWSDPALEERAIVLDALVSIRQDDLPAARRKAREGSARFPYSARLLNLQALVTMREGDLEGARELFRQAIAVDPSDTTAAINLAALANRAGDPERARDLLVDFVDAFPDDALALTALSGHYLAIGDLDEARVRLEQARAADPQAVPARLRLAEIYARNGQFNEAEAIAREVIAAQPRLVGGHNALAIALLGQNRIDEAVTSLRRALQIDPQAREALRNLLRVEFQRGQATQARQTAEQLLAVAPDDEVGLELAARLAISGGRLEEGEALLERLVAAAPARTELTSLVLRGDIALARGELAEADRLFREAFALRPSATIVERVFRVASADGREAPQSILQDWLADHPDDLRIHQLLGQYLQGQGDDAGAVRHYERIVEAQPENALVLNNLAWAYAEVGDARALRVAQRASDLAPDAPAVQDTYGWMLILDGQYANGVSLLRDAWEAAPNVGDIGYHLAEGLMRSGERAEAREVLRQTLERAGNFPTREQAQVLFEELSSEI